jgi:hypothetical protein
MCGCLLVLFWVQSKLIFIWAYYDKAEQARQVCASEQELAGILG